MTKPNTPLQSLIDESNRQPSKPKAKSKTKRQPLPQEIISGMGPQPVRLVSGPVGGLSSCADDKHCCAHGDGPFNCCRCGSRFVAA